MVNKMLANNLKLSDFQIVSSYLRFEIVVWMLTE
jgi:hypothetical protein